MSHIEIEVKHPDDAADPERWGIRLEVVITVLLGIAAVTAAFAAFRSEQLSSESRNRLATSQLNETLYVAHNTTRRTVQASDMQLFLEYEQAWQQANVIRTRAIYDLMSHNLQQLVLDSGHDPNIAPLAFTDGPSGIPSARPDIEALSENPVTNPESLFAKDSYLRHIGDAERDERLLDRTEEYAREGLHLSTRSDRYLRVTIVIATALFLYGIAAVSRPMRIKLGTLAVGFAVFLVALGLLAFA